MTSLFISSSTQAFLPSNSFVKKSKCALTSEKRPWSTKQMRMNFREEPFPDRHLVTNNVYESAFQAIGNTPLIKLRRASEETGCNVYGKAEFLNPGGSIKARAALYLIKDAEEKGLLTPGKPGFIVESSGGNTGISLAEIATARGYQCIVVIPDNQSQDKKDLLRYAGATLVEIPKLPYTNPNNYIRLGRRIAKHLGAVYTNQFDNVANRRAHIESTGPEIWAQLNGKIDGFSCAAGTGGTLAGTAQYLRSMNESIKIGITDPRGAKLVRYFRDGAFESVGESISEGIGQERITANLEGFRPDYMFELHDNEGLYYSFKLMREEGLYLGTSSGINVAGSIKLAHALGPGHTVVTVLCDLATRYQNKIFNCSFLESKGLSTPAWIEDGMSDVIREAKYSSLVPELEATAEQRMAEEKKTTQVANMY